MASLLTALILPLALLLLGELATPGGSGGGAGMGWGGRGGTHALPVTGGSWKPIGPPGPARRFLVWRNPNGRLDLPGPTQEEA